MGGPGPGVFGGSLPVEITHSHRRFSGHDTFFLISFALSFTRPTAF